jgi:site-specific DNA-cytosine methylase
MEAMTLDPLGLDSHRYRCCGNGVATPVAEWLGWRLRRYLEGDL